MTTYKFSFPMEAVGLAVTVRDAARAVVDTGVVSSPADDSGAATYQTDLPDGTYVASVPTTSIGQSTGRWTDTPWRREGNTIETLGVAATGGGAGGSTEYAKFIGRATGDSSGNQFDVTFEVDGTPVSWAGVDGDGNIALDGPIICDQVLYRYNANLDFSAATGFSTADSAPDTDATVLMFRDTDPNANNIGGPYAFIPTGTPGNTFDIDAVEPANVGFTRMAGNALMTFKSQLNCNAYDAAGDQVTDGVFTGAIAIWISRCILPDVPPLN